MSAYLVSKKHIDVLTDFIIKMAVRSDAPDNVGRILWGENLESVANRYPSIKSGDLPGQDRADEEIIRYKFQKPDREYSIPEIIKAVHCLDYQSSEHSGWNKSVAQKILRDTLRCASRLVDGYEEAKWGID